jgi:hypothetical protein
MQAYAAVNWVLTQEPLDVETELALGFLDYLLLGTPAAPLRKALNDSNLGAALVGGGMDDELKQPIFSVGLKVGAEVTLSCKYLGGLSNDQHATHYCCKPVHSLHSLGLQNVECKPHSK